MAKKTTGLKPNPRNPRRVTDKKLQMLQKAMERFGDLGGIVVNRRTGQLISGHQRVDAAQIDENAITVTQEYEPPTRTGTVAEGHIMVNGERFSYRLVDMDESTATAAGLAANKSAGDFDMPMLGDLMGELVHFNMDMDLTMFSNAERESLVSTDSFEEQGAPPERLDQNKPTICPSCGHEFFKA